MLIRENVPLAPLTTLGVGGPAPLFCRGADRSRGNRSCRVRPLPPAAVVRARRRQQPGCSGCGFSRLGVEGWDHRCLALPASNGIVTFLAGAGLRLGHLGLSDCRRRLRWAGMPQRNSRQRGRHAGAKCRRLRPGSFPDNSTRCASSICNRSRSRRYPTPIAGSLIAPASSIRSERGRYIILRVSFAVRPERQAQPELCRLAEVLRQSSGRTIAGRGESGGTRNSPWQGDADRSRRRRRAQRWLVFQESGGTAKSFRRAVGSLRSRGLQLPNYPAADGFRKLPAAWLVEHAGFAKGYVKGAAGISRRHALAIINRGGATAGDIIALKNEIQSRVQAEFGIELQPEPVFVGF